MLENAIKITSTSKFSTPIVQIPSHLHPALSYGLDKGKLPLYLRLEGNYIDEAIIQEKTYNVFPAVSHKNTKTDGSDCSLRQGAGGREFARLGSRTWFLRLF